MINKEKLIKYIEESLDELRENEDIEYDENGKEGRESILESILFRINWGDFNE